MLGRSAIGGTARACGAPPIVAAKDKIDPLTVSARSCCSQCHEVQMRYDSRLSRMIHVLIHMDKRGGRTTSGTIALMQNTNPVVVRRTMAPLKHAGLVNSDGGGRWGMVAESRHR